MNQQNPSAMKHSMKVVAAILCLAVMMLLGLPASASSPAPAGQQIDNEALVIYQDSATGIVSKLKSNLVRLSVSPQEALSLTQDHSIISAVATPLVFSHRLVNTGNVTSTFSISAVNATGDDYDLQQVTAYQDVNSNGVLDPGEPVIPDHGTVTLAAGDSTNILVAAFLPATIPSDKTAKLQLSAQSSLQNVSAINTDSVSTSSTATVQLSKIASDLAPRPGEVVTFTLNAVNAGNSNAGPVSVMIDGAAASMLIVRDALPPNTSFTGFVSTGSGTALYHLRGMPAAEYVTAAPSDLSQVDAVAFGYPSLNIGQAASGSFKLRVSDNASGAIFNTAQVLFNDGVDETINSNQVQLSVPVSAPTIRFYTGNDYSKYALIGHLGSPVFVQANASACNLNATVAETHNIRITSKLTGDSELFAAIESGPNTGIFRILPQAPTADSTSTAPSAGDGIISASKNDILTATITDCGPNAASTSLLLDPAGVVFDSRTDQPIAGATVTLIDVSGNGNGGKANDLAKVLAADGSSPAPSTVTTGPDGRFQFPVVAPSTYRLLVTPMNGFAFPSGRAISLLPADRTINDPGSFGGNFTVTADTGTVLLDVPMDPASISGLFIDKVASSSYAEVGDFIDYTITIKNQSGYSLPHVTVSDSLPIGFKLQSDSPRLNKQPLGKSDVQGGRNVTFDVGLMPSGSQSTLTYRVLIGPAAMQGDGINRAQATSDRAQSNTASVRVVLQGGVFSDRGFITGKVFADCDGDGLQSEGEVGIPGVRIYLDDGTFVVTDSEGKYSLYGVLPRLHVMRIDPVTLPQGARPSYLTSRDAGDPSTRFLDIQSGELYRADFPMYACRPNTVAEIAQRRKSTSRETAEGERVLNGQFLAQRPVQSDTEIKSLSASGIIGNFQPGEGGALPAASTGISAGGPQLRKGDPVTVAPEAEGMAASASTPAGLSTAAASAAPAAMIEAAVPADNKLGFVDLKDNDVVPFTQVNIRVKGNSAAVLRLKVNDKELPLTRVGKKSIYVEKHVSVWEYIGVALNPGPNQVTLLEVDPFGNTRGSETIDLIAPNKLGKLIIELPHTAYADGVTPVPVNIRLTDANGVPVTVRTEITLDSSLGTWNAKDADPSQSGLQVFIEGGHAQLYLVPPAQPGTASIHIASGDESAEAKLALLPELRPLIALGSTEQVFNFSKQSGNAAALSGFESDIDRLSAGSGDGFKFASHTALLMKGKVKGDSLLTFSYDSEKAKNQELFRDIQPDDYYPVYGDSSVRGYEAQSTNPMYLRLDHGRSYLLWGDYTTQDSANPARVVSAYSRSMTGVRQHVETDHFSFTGFGSHEASEQSVEEIRANGTSGPFFLSRADVRPNSEKVELVTRDRNQPALVVNVVEETRFSDYQFDAESGEILFKGPIPSFDPGLNPIYVRVTYEYDSGGPKFWVTGAEGQVKLNRNFALGGVFVNDENPENHAQLRGVNATINAGPVGSSRVDLQACKLEYSIVSPK